MSTLFAADDIDEDDIEMPPVGAPVGQPSSLAPALMQPPPIGQESSVPEPELELTPAASAAELEEQVAELMMRDRQGALKMVRAILRRCTPSEFESLDVRAMEAEAKRLLLEAKRQEKEAEKNAKRLAKLAEDEARRQQKEAEQEAKARQRLELAAEKKRQKMEQTSQSEANREKAVGGAAKKGYTVGMKVEAPLTADCVDSRAYEGSWYSGTITELQAQRGGGGVRALVRFEPHDELGLGAVGAGSADGGSGSADAAGSPPPPPAGWLLLDSLRPAPPQPPPNFGSMVEPGQSLEVFLEGGWWEVEMLGSSRDSAPAPPDPTQTLAVGRCDREPGVRTASTTDPQSGAPLSALAAHARRAARRRSLVMISKPGSEYDGLRAHVTAMEAGWVKVSVPEAELQQKQPRPKAPLKHFRDKELRLLPPPPPDGAAAAPAGAAAAPEAGADAPEGAAAAADGGAVASGPAEVEATTYVVRLLTAAAEAEGVYHVPIERLRPGWQWKPGTSKWVGRWADKKGRARGAASASESGGGAANGGGGASGSAAHKPEDARAAADALRRAWPLQTRVEVMQSDEGYEGSWYAGSVVGYEPPLVRAAPPLGAPPCTFRARPAPHLPRRCPTPCQAPSIARARRS